MNASMPIIPDTPAGLAALEFFAAMCDKYRRPSDAVPAAEHPPDDAPPDDAAAQRRRRRKRGR